MHEIRRRFLVVGGVRPEAVLPAELFRGDGDSDRGDVVGAPDPAGARAVLDERGFDAVLVDVDGLPEGTFHELEGLVVHGAGPPVLALTSRADPRFAARLLELGFDDCLVKATVDAKCLARAVVLGAARRALRARLYAESLTDELTGLYNRRGFLRIGAQFLDGARRRGSGAWLLFADVRGLKRINDRFGHAAGDRALRAVAGLLCRSFRRGDVVARLGGDEFTILAGDASEVSREILVSRILARIHEAGRAAGPSDRFGLWVGAARARPGDPASLEDLLRAAGEEAAAAKRREHAAPGTDAGQAGG